VNDSRDNLSTADLAGQTPERTERDGYDEPDRSADPVRDETESYRADDSVGVADDATGPVGDTAYDEPVADYDGDTAGATRAEHDRDTDDPHQRSTTR
jgi:hypothetical protein